MIINIIKGKETLLVNKIDDNNDEY